MLSPLSREASVGMLFTKATHARSRSTTPGAEGEHVVRDRIAPACMSEAMSATL
jgi:hypothetical protein